MANGWFFFGLTTLMSVAVFLNGLRFSRMPEERVLDGRTQIELPSFLARGRTPLAQARLVGRIQMIGAPIFLLFFAALSFGIFGPVEGIQTIR